MKIKITWFFVLFIALLTSFSSCKKDEKTPALNAEDGWYISGEATSFTDLAVTNLFKSTPNENATVTARDGLYSKYVYLTAGKTFVITKVIGGVGIVYGATDTITYNPNGKSDQLKSNIQWGTLATGKTLQVPKTGMYQVCFDVNSNKIAVAELTHWGVIGGATPGGWGGNQVMNLVGTLNAETNTYTVANVVLTVDKFKFRHSDGWKIQLSDTGAMTKDNGVKVNSNYGGTVDALVVGGADIPNTVNGVYTLSLTWTKTSGEFTASVIKTGDYTPPSFPDSMYIAGSAVIYEWNPGATLSAMHAVADGPNKGMYWKICYIEADKGFKLSNKNWSSPNLNFGDVTEFDPTGIAVSADGDNWKIATSGLYMVVLDLRNNTKKVSIKEPMVYGIGDAFGGYDSGKPANLFTVDNTAKTLTSPALPAAGNIRIYASHPWIPAWWNAEFNVFSTDIKYRNDGGDQDAVPGTAGKVITLHFDDNTGAIN